MSSSASSKKTICNKMRFPSRKWFHSCLAIEMIRRNQPCETLPGDAQSICKSITKGIEEQTCELNNFETSSNRSDISSHSFDLSDSERELRLSGGNRSLKSSGKSSNVSSLAPNSSGYDSEFIEDSEYQEEKVSTKSSSKSGNSSGYDADFSDSEDDSTSKPGKKNLNLSRNSSPSSAYDSGFSSPGAYDTESSDDDDSEASIQSGISHSTEDFTRDWDGLSSVMAPNLKDFCKLGNDILAKNAHFKKLHQLPKENGCSDRLKVEAPSNPKKLVKQLSLDAIFKKVSEPTPEQLSHAKKLRSQISPVIYKYYNKNENKNSTEEQKQQELENYLVEAVQAIEASKKDLILESQKQNQALYLNKGDYFQGIEFPASIVVLPDGQIILNLKTFSKKLNAVGAGFFSEATLAFDYEDGTAFINKTELTPSPGFGLASKILTYAGPSRGLPKAPVFFQYASSKTDKNLKERLSNQALQNTFNDQGLPLTGPKVVKRAEIQEYLPFGVHEYLHSVRTDPSKLPPGKSYTATFYDLAEDLLAGYAHLHEKNIIHGDTKEDNMRIAIDQKTGLPAAKLIDFDSARFMTQDPNKAAPDFDKKYIDRRAARDYLNGGKVQAEPDGGRDIWALALTLAFMHENIAPFSKGHFGDIERVHAKKLEKIDRKESIPENHKKAKRIEENKRYLKEIAGQVAGLQSLKDVEAAYGLNLTNRPQGDNGFMSLIGKMLEPQDEKRISAEAALHELAKIKKQVK